MLKMLSDLENRGATIVYVEQPEVSNTLIIVIGRKTAILTFIFLIALGLML